MAESNGAVRRVRGLVAVLLALLAIVCAAASVVAVWGRDQVLDTDRYLETVAPLADDPVIQAEVAGEVSDAITSRLAGRLTPEIEAQVVAATYDVVHSSDFARLWVAANRIGHAELVRLLTGEEPPGVVVEAGRIQLDLSALVGEVRGRLAAAGLAIVASMPPITLVVDVADADGLTAARDAVDLLDTIAWWLPVVALGLLVAAALVATRRRRTAARTLVVIAWAMVLLRAVIALGKRLAVDEVPADVVSPKAVEHYYDHLLAPLVGGVLGTAITALVLVVVVAVAAVDVRRRRVPAGHLAAVLGAGAAVLVVAGWAAPVVAGLGVVLAVAGVVLAVRGDRQAVAASSSPATSST